jgi:hypothetical protein
MIVAGFKVGGGDDERRLRRTAQHAIELQHNTVIVNCFSVHFEGVERLEGLRPTVTTGTATCRMRREVYCCYDTKIHWPKPRAASLLLFPKLNSVQFLSLRLGC